MLESISSLSSIKFSIRPSISPSTWASIASSISSESVTELHVSWILLWLISVGSRVGVFVSVILFVLPDVVLELWLLEVVLEERLMVDLICMRFNDWWRLSSSFSWKLTGRIFIDSRRGFKKSGSSRSSFFNNPLCESNRLSLAKSQAFIKAAVSSSILALGTGLWFI